MRRAIVRWLPIAVVLSSLLGCRGGASSPPKDQVVRQVTTDLLTHVQQRQYAAVWDTLHPAQQVLLPREQLVACGERFGPAFEAFSIAEVTMEDVTPDAVGQTTASVVTVSFDLTPEFAQGSATPIDRRFRFVEVDGGWCWLLGTGELAVFKQGNCGLPWPGGGHAP